MLVPIAEIYRPHTDRYFLRCPSRHCRAMVPTISETLGVGSMSRGRRRGALTLGAISKDFPAAHSIDLAASEVIVMTQSHIYVTTSKQSSLRRSVIR
jgi:tRNA A37 threonylcarbamoyladenosine synthetase subunit TsaC/SUA5/YrdC